MPGILKQCKGMVYAYWVKEESHGVSMLFKEKVLRKVKERLTNEKGKIIVLAVGKSTVWYRGEMGLKDVDLIFSFFDFDL